MKKFLFVFGAAFVFCKCAFAQEEFKLLKEDSSLNVSDFLDLTTQHGKPVCQIKNTSFNKEKQMKTGYTVGDGEIFCNNEDAEPYMGMVYNTYPNNELRTRVSLVQGRFEGLLEIYYPNGKPKVLANYKNGVLNGVRKTYYENGQLEKKGKYKDGKQDGLWKVYDQKGNFETEVLFRDGEPYY